MSAAESYERQDAKLGSTLSLVSGACMMPHPEKEHRGGEDAYFIEDDMNCLGVADGVGGWNEQGVDPGIFAQTLMSSAADECLRGGGGDPVAIMSKGYEETQGLLGSSTVLVLCLCSANRKLKVANLGDSGFLVIRSGREVMRSVPQQHRFNTPFQIGPYGVSETLPEHSERFDVDVKVGDVVVVATDGLFDNLYTAEIVRAVRAAFDNGANPQQTAQALAKIARRNAEDEFRFSPFAQEATRNGYAYIGGKLDDITVVVSFVVDNVTAAENASKM